ncbi:hypothetical protein BKA93DRAFT_794398 [Sparassis latifolia]
MGRSFALVICRKAGSIRCRKTCTKLGTLVAFLMVWAPTTSTAEAPNSTSPLSYLPIDSFLCSSIVARHIPTNGVFLPQRLRYLGGTSRALSVFIVCSSNPVDNF